ncbi:MAG: TIM barrel protein [Planctomycetota bacterium]
MRLAFSTVACPDWPLGRAIALAEELGYDGLEMRTFGEASNRFACDPALTDSGKLGDLFRGAAVTPACVATGLRFDKPIFPPVVGRLFDQDITAARQAKWIIRRAAEFGCPFVRVFGFERSGSEKLQRTIRRVRAGLELTAAAARNTGVRVLVENGGSFARSGEMLALLDGLDTRLVGVSFNPDASAQADEDPLGAFDRLGDLVGVVKLKDRADDGSVVPIGDGSLPIEQLVRTMVDHDFRGFATVEWDRAWLPDLAAPEGVLGESIRRVYEWRKKADAGRASAGWRAPELASVE